VLELVVVGGGGMIGRRIVREALERGHAVTVVARDATKVTDEHERLRVVEADVLDADAMAELAAGCDVVVSAVGTARADTPDYSVYQRAAESLVAALRSFGESGPRLIVVGGVGSLLDGAGEPVLRRVPEDRLPEHLDQQAALDVRWTYLSPPARIAPGERTGSYRIGADRLLVSEDGESSISMEDYAVAILDEAETPRHVGRRFTVASRA